MGRSIFYPLAYFISCRADALHSHVIRDRYATPMSYFPPLDESGGGGRNSPLSSTGHSS